MVNPYFTLESLENRMDISKPSFRQAKSGASLTCSFPELGEPERIENEWICVDLRIPMEVLEVHRNLITGRNDDPIRQLAIGSSETIHPN